ncbi:hypothetical protein M2161_007834 [Streptomyces sp. SAI-133]|uniref:hypothetical protein n=1 Tax=unclassified Streptomyces TaxID=2593676 RepID=UPI00247532BB|nr:hypothetical protein [Streptomyces sp. SAI-133]MDH6588728.1 hypothetical protein [Streptomyces sp. SAI-133]
MGSTGKGAAAEAARLAVGLVDLAVRAVAGTARDAAHARAEGVTAVPDAALGLALELRRRSSWVRAGVGAVAAPGTRAAVRLLVPSRATDAVARRITRWRALGAAERLRARDEAALRARALVRTVAAAVLDEIDVDAVADRLDVDRVAARIDLDAVLARVDLDGVLDRVDPDTVVARVDLDSVLDRVDLDALVARVDPDSVLARVDLVTYAESVLDELDLGRVVRDTGGSITAETLDSFREQNARADRLVQRITDRLLHRAGPSGADGSSGGRPPGPAAPLETP